MNNEVNELRNQLLREQQLNHELQESLQKEKEKQVVTQRSLSSLRKSYEAFHNQTEMEEEKFVNKVRITSFSHHELFRDNVRLTSDFSDECS